MLVYYYSCVCFFLLLHSCCSHARGILRGIHTLCMGSLFPIVHAKWYNVLRSFRTTSYWTKTALNFVKIIKNNNPSYNDSNCYWMIVTVIAAMIVIIVTNKGVNTWQVNDNDSFNKSLTPTPLLLQMDGADGAPPQGGRHARVRERGTPQPALLEGTLPQGTWHVVHRQ